MDRYAEREGSVAVKLRIFAAVTAFIFLVGCAADLSNAELPSYTDESAVRGYTFAVGTNASHALTSAAAFFGGRVNEISLGQLRIETMPSNDPLQDLLDGTAQLAILSSEEVLSLSEYAAALRLPFNYRNYTHFTMAVNNEQVLSVLAAEMDAEHGVWPVAGFFYGTRHFLSQGALPEFPDHIFEGAAAVLPNSNMAYGLAVMGYQVLTQESYERRISMLESGEVSLIEVTALELTTNSDWIEERFDLILSRHDMDKQFLVMRSDFWNTLPPALGAALTEAASYMSSLIDNVHIRRDVMLHSMINYGFTQIHILPIPEMLPLISRSAWHQSHNTDELFGYLAELVIGI